MKNKLQTQEQMISTSSSDGIIGMDLGDRWSRYCIVDAAGTIVKEDRVRTTPEALAECFEKLPPYQNCDRGGYAFSMGEPVTGEAGPPGDRGQRPQGAADL